MVDWDHEGDSNRLKKSLQSRVDQALDEAVFAAGFFDILYHTPREVALDLRAFSGFGGDDLDEVIACVKDYQKWNEARERVDRGVQVTSVL